MSPFPVQKVPLIGAAEVLRWGAEVALGRSSKETSITIGMCLHLHVLLAKCGPNMSQSFVNKGSHLLERTRPLCPWDFPGKSTGVGCHRFLRKKGLAVFNFLSIFCSGEVFILFSFQNGVFKYSSLAVLSFNTWNTSSHFLLAH